MALKDWKKAKYTGNIWSYFHSSPLYQIWIDKNYKGYWEFHSQIDGIKVFKTKSEAIKFAKAYMRTH